MVKNQNGKHVISTTVDPDDYDYVNRYGLKFSHIIRAFLRDHRQTFNPDEVEQTTLMLKKKIEAVSNLNEKVMRFLDSKGLSDEFIGGHNNENK